MGLTKRFADIAKVAVAVGLHSQLAENDLESDSGSRESIVEQRLDQREKEGQEEPLVVRRTYDGHWPK